MPCLFLNHLTFTDRLIGTHVLVDETGHGQWKKVWYLGSESAKSIVRVTLTQLVRGWKFKLERDPSGPNSGAMNFCEVQVFSYLGESIIQK